MNLDNIEIVDSTPQDVFGIRNVQKITWIDTYPNLELGITKEDIKSNFSKDNTKEGSRQIEGWKSRYSDPNEHRWVAKDGNEIVGFCVVSREKSNYRIQAIYVLPSYQGNGIGRRLFDMSLQWLGNDKDIYVNVVSYNVNAIKFYEKFGFIKTGKNVVDDIASLPSGVTLPEIEMVKKIIHR